MKKGKLIVLAAASAVLCLAAAGCGSHKHTYGDWTVTTKPTLETGGVSTRVCTEDESHTETYTLPSLSDKNFWTETETKQASHTEGGVITYTSAYGSFTVDVPKGEHEYVWTILPDHKPTLTEGGQAKGVCNAEQAETTVDIPNLNDTSVWTKNAEKSSPASCTKKGKDVYVSKYGEVEVELAVIPHTAGDWEVTQAPTEENKGTATTACTECGAAMTKELPNLKDTSFWTKGDEVTADYNHMGYIPYTNAEFNLEVQVKTVDQLVAPYANTDYFNFVVNLERNDALINGKVSIGTSYDRAHVLLDKTSKGVGDAHPFRGNVTFYYENEATGKVRINIVNGDSEYNYDGYFDKTTKVIAMFYSSHEVYFLTPFFEEKEDDVYDDETETTHKETRKYAISTASGSAWSIDNEYAFVLDYNYNATDTLRVYIHEGEVHFGVTFASGKDAAAATVAAQDAFGTQNLYVKDADGTVIAAYAKKGNTMVVADGKEGIYTGTLDGTAFTLNVSGAGEFIGGAQGDYYEVAPAGSAYTIGAYLDGAYYEITLNSANGTFTANKPMVTVTLHSDYDTAKVGEKQANKNVVFDLPVLEDAENSFGGWFFDSACNNPVPENFKPTTNVDLYAKWASKFVVHAVVKSGDTRDIYYGIGDIIGTKLPELHLDPATNSVFEGWYLDSNFENLIDEESEIAANENNELTIYAKWIPAGTWTLEQGSTYGFEYDATRDVWQSTNKGVSTSSATLEIIAHGEIEISFKYAASSEGGSYDNLEVRWYPEKNGSGSQVIGTVGGKIDYDALDWKTYSAKLNDGEIILFTYKKDSSGDHKEDRGFIKELTINGRAITLSGTVDFLEGTYKSADKDDLVLNGYGAFTWGSKSGTYAKTEGKIDMFVVDGGKNVEYYELTLDGENYTVVKPEVVLSFDCGEVTTVADANVNKNAVYTLTDAPEISGYLFRGWYDNAEFTGSVLTEITLSANKTLYAKYSPAISVTVVYGNEIANGSVEGKFAGDEVELDLPDPANNKYPAGWYTTETFDEGTEWTSGSVVESNITLYCKWVVPHALMGSYLGANLDPSEAGIAKETDGSYTSSFAVDAFGNATGWKSGTIEEYDAATSSLVLVSGSSRYYGAADVANGFVYFDYLSGKTEPYHDIQFFILTNGEVTGKSTVNTAWDKGCTKLVEVTYSDNTTKTLFIYQRAIYGNVTWTAQKADGTAITSAADLAANVDYITITAGDIVWKFAKANNNLVETDGTEGTYTCEGKENIVLNGAGVISYNGKSGTVTAIEENVYRASFSDVTYIVTINVTAKTYEMQDDKVVVSYNFGSLGASLADASVYSGVSFTLAAAPEITGYIFRGWYPDAEFTGSAVTRITPTENTVVYAKYAPAITVTVVYGNGTEDGAITDKFAGDTVTLALPDAKNNLVAEGWYTSSDFNEADKWTSGSVVEGDLTLYCKWITPHALMGVYKGFEFDSTTLRSSVKTITIDAFGKASGDKSGQIGDFVAGNSGVLKIGTVYAYYDADSNTIVTNYGSGTDGLSTDVYVLIKVSDSSVVPSVTTSNYVVWNSNASKLGRFTVDGSEKTFLVYDNRVYGDVTVSVVDKDGAPVAEMNKFKTTGNVMTIKKGNTLVAEFGYVDGNFLYSDGSQGTYANASVLGNIVSDGYGNLTIGTGDDKYTVAYTFAETKLQFVANNRMYVVSLDQSAHTYTQVQDGYQGTYTLPDGAGNITLDGLGGAGDGATYAVSGVNITVYTATGKTSYGIDVDNKVFLGKSIFAGLTFAGRYTDNYGETNTCQMIFEDDVAIAGEIKCGVYGSFLFTGALDGNVLTLTLTKAISGASDVGKTVIMTIDGSTMTRTGGTYRSNAYLSGLTATCEGFSL